MHRGRWMTVGLLSLASFGCAGRGSASNDQQGRIALAITSAPPDATCIQVLVSGTRSVERDVDVTPGQSTILVLEGLPEGTDTITVNAYSGSCSALTGSSIPTWVGDPVVVAVTPDPVDVMVTLHRNQQNGRISIGVNFDDDAGAKTDGGGAGGSTGGGDSGGSPVTTESILHSRGSDCFSCVQDNGCLDPAQQGGTCEGTPGTAPAACSAPLGAGSSVSETEVCLKTLGDIFTSQCAVTQQLTPCLCGSTDAGQCLAGTAAPTGPLLSVYQCELGTTAPEISSNFTNQAFGAGQANAVAQCAGAFGCSCF